jgi:hypothetical protein
MKNPQQRNKKVDKKDKNQLLAKVPEEIILQTIKGFILTMM